MSSAAASAATGHTGDGSRTAITAAADGSKSGKHSRGVRTVAAPAGDRLVGQTHPAQRLEFGVTISAAILVQRHNYPLFKAGTILLHFPKLVN
jgi:hypothetical protein